MHSIAATALSAKADRASSWAGNAIGTLNSSSAWVFGLALLRTQHFSSARVQSSLCALCSEPIFGFEKTCQLKSWRSQGGSQCTLCALCVLCAKPSFFFLEHAALKCGVHRSDRGGVKGTYLAITSKQA